MALKVRADGSGATAYTMDWCDKKILDIRVPKGTLDMFDKMVITRIENENNITITIGEFE